MVKKILNKRKGSALSLSLIFVFVGTLITVSYLEYLQVASKQQYGQESQNLDRLIAQAGIQLHFHRLQRLFFRYEQSYLEGDIMGGKYEVLSRSYYETGKRNVEIIGVGRHGTTKAAVSRLLSVNTPTDYVRFFDGNYLKIMAGQATMTYMEALSSFFWIGPVHSNGSIGLGIYDSDYNQCLAKNEYHDTNDLGKTTGGTDWLNKIVTNPNLCVNNTQRRKQPKYWGMLGFIVKDKDIKGPVISTAGYLFIPENYPKKSWNDSYASSFGSFFYLSKLAINEGDFAHPILVGEADDPAVIVNKDDSTYPVDSDPDNRDARFGLYNGIRDFNLYNLVTCKKTETLAHGDSKNELLSAGKGGVSIKLYPFLTTVDNKTVALNRPAYKSIIYNNNPCWGNAYDGAEEIKYTRDMFSDILSRYGGFPYPLVNYRDEMPKTTLPTQNTPNGLLSMENSEGSIIRIPTIRKKTGGLDYANMPFKSLAEWQEELRRYYRSYVDPNFNYSDSGGQTMTLVNHASREKMECQNNQLPNKYADLKGIRLKPMEKDHNGDPFTGNDAKVDRFEFLWQNFPTDIAGELPMRIRAISRITRSGPDSLWSGGLELVHFNMTTKSTPNTAYFYKTENGTDYGSLPTVKRGGESSHDRYGRTYPNANGYNVPIDLRTFGLGRGDEATPAHKIKTRRYPGGNYGNIPRTYNTPNIQFTDPSKLNPGTWIYLELTTDYINNGAGLSNSGSASYSYEDCTDFIKADTYTGPALFSTQTIPPSGLYVPHTNTGVFLGSQPPEDVCRFYRAGDLGTPGAPGPMIQHFQKGVNGIDEGQCGFQVPVDIFGAETKYTNDRYMQVRRIFYNIANPSTLFDQEKNDPFWSNSTNNMTADDVSGFAGDGRVADVIRMTYTNHVHLITAEPTSALWVNPWFKLHFAPGTKDIGTTTSVKVDAYLETEYQYPFFPWWHSGVEWYNNNLKTLPHVFNYRVTANKKIIPTWQENNWLDYESLVPDDRKWYAPLVQEARILNLSQINSSNFPRTQNHRSEPGVIYSKVPLLVYGNPSVPVTVVCEQNVYLKSINGYFPATPSGEAVKELGTADKPSVGIISAEGVWVVPLSERGDGGYDFPGGPGDIILNNVAIWTTKGFFSMMGRRQKMVLAGSVITMDSNFGKVFHPSYTNFGESFHGYRKSRTPISGLGATDAALRDEHEGTMFFNRESFQYTKMFRGDDRHTPETIEGPPPHLPVFFKLIYENNLSLEYAEKYFEYLKPYIKENQNIPAHVLEQVRQMSR